MADAIAKLGFDDLSLKEVECIIDSMDTEVLHVNVWHASSSNPTKWPWPDGLNCNVLMRIAYASLA